MQSDSVSAPPPRLLDQLRERIRYKHYSIRTEQAYVHWVRAFIRHHGLRHPGELGAVEVEHFLAWLANDRQVAPSTHTQALSALLFLYREVLRIDLPWLKEIGRPKQRERVPVVLSRTEVTRLLSVMEDTEGDLASTGVLTPPAVWLLARRRSLTLESPLAGERRWAQLH